jgi:hypothetical protein
MVLLGKKEKEKNLEAILIKKEDKEYLDSLKKHPREPYYEVIQRILEERRKRVGLFGGKGG